MLHSIQFSPHYAVHHKHHPDQCADVYLLVQQTATLQTAPQYERTLCIHEHGLPHGLCQCPCPYTNYETISYMDSLDLSDISDYEDYMVTSSDKEIPGMEEVPY